MRIQPTGYPNLWEKLEIDHLRRGVEYTVEQLAEVIIEGGYFEEESIKAYLEEIMRLNLGSCHYDF